MKGIENSLSTEKYTKVLVDKSEIMYSAPHKFQVINNETKEVLANISFQNGAIKEHGINGVCNEDLIVMVLERMYYFQNSLFNCKENEQAIINLEQALMWLHKRTMDRELRGVEGTHRI